MFNVTTVPTKRRSTGLIVIVNHILYVIVNHMYVIVNNIYVKQVKQRINKKPQVITA